MKLLKILGDNSQITCREIWLIAALLTLFFLFSSAIVLNKAQADHSLASALVSAAAILGGSVIVAAILLVYLVNLLAWYRNRLELRDEVRHLGHKLESSRGKLMEMDHLISELEQIRSHGTGR